MNVIEQMKLRAISGAAGWRWGVWVGWGLAATLYLAVLLLLSAAVLVALGIVLRAWNWMVTAV